MCVDRLVGYLRFYVPLKNFHLYGDVTIAGEGLQNLGLWSALRAFEQGGIFIVPHLLWHGTSVFPVSSEGPPHSVASYDTRGGVHGGSILTLILTGIRRSEFTAGVISPQKEKRKDSLTRFQYISKFEEWVE
jgi:hypothetical protein